MGGGDRVELVGLAASAAGRCGGFGCLADGDSFDNALMENFWSTLKIELVYRTSWRTRDEAENAIFAYLHSPFHPA
ncbi:hypothetical protein ABZ780_29230 [Micromonospora sp. NPDC047467]|uniref:hypothetical protein n=1 Tax=Micromonospora sp. NPDC047467 TaxID=3154814 RepID=UPI0033F7EF3A